MQHVEGVTAVPVPSRKTGLAGGSGHFQPAHGAGGGGEAVGFDAQLLEHGDVEVRQRVVAPGVEGEVLAVLEAAACEAMRSSWAIFCMFFPS